MGRPKIDPTVKADVTPVSWQEWLLGRKRARQRETQELVLMLRAEMAHPPRGATNGQAPAAK